MKYIKAETKPIFNYIDRGYRIKAWYLIKPEGEALVILIYKRKIIKRFLFPSYKIWNIAAHFSDIVDSELNNNVDGYNIAGSNGLGGGRQFKKEVK